MEESEVPQIDNKEEAVAYAIKNYYKVIALIVAVTFCAITIVGSVLYIVKKADIKVTTPIMTVEKK